MPDIRSSGSKKKNEGSHSERVVKSNWLVVDGLETARLEMDDFVAMGLKRWRVASVTLSLTIL